MLVAGCRCGHYPPAKSELKLANDRRPSAVHLCGANIIILKHILHFVYSSMFFCVFNVHA